MDSENESKVEEKGLADHNGVQNTVKDETAESGVSENHSRQNSRQTTSTSTEAPSEEPPSDDVEARDLEQLAPVQSRPLYSVFSRNQKRYVIFMVTCASFVSPVCANIYFPALNPLAIDLGVSTTLINLTVTSYMLFQGMAPMLTGDLADMAGRRPAYIVAFIVALGANIGLALQNSYVALFLLRCLQSTGSSGAIALGYGVVADVSTPAERGSFMGMVTAGTMMGPALGPVIGGLLAEFLGWRSIFWFITIFIACWIVPYILTVPETGRNVVGNGSIPPQGWNMTLIDYVRFRRQRSSENSLQRTETAESRRNAQAELARHRKIGWPNPLKTLKIVTEKDCALILIYNSLIYSAFYDMMATIPSQYKEIYGFNDLQVGLCYIPFGAGCAISAFTNGKMLDRNYKRVARQIGFSIDHKRGDDLRYYPIERARIQTMWPMLSVGLASVLCYGWVLQQEVHLAVPLLMTFLMGLCLNGAFNVLATLLVDLYPESPATATAANNLVRCFMGAGAIGIVDIMINRMGRGWCFTFLALVCTATIPLILIELKWGPVWREERTVRMEKAEEERIRKQARAREDMEERTNVDQPAQQDDEKGAT